MYEVWAGDGQHHHLILATDSYRDAYETASTYQVVIWLVDPTRSICEPMPWHG